MKMNISAFPGNCCGVKRSPILCDCPGPTWRKKTIIQFSGHSAIEDVRFVFHNGTARISNLLNWHVGRKCYYLQIVQAKEQNCDWFPELSEFCTTDL